MLDLDLIKTGGTGVRPFSKADPSIASGLTNAAINAGDFAADLLQE